MIVRRDVIDEQPAGEAHARGLDRRGCDVELSPAWQQRRPVRQSPAIVLDMSDLEPVSAELHGEIDDVFETFQILPVNDRVDGQRQIRLAHQTRNPMLCRVSPARPAIRSPEAGSESCKLSWTCSSPASTSRPRRSASSRIPGRDQIDVEPGRGGSCDEFDEVAAHQWLAAGEMHLQDAQCSRLREHSAPARGVKLDTGPRELQRI